ncbi:MmgE/PrpD family protein [Variovorax boronicumulans]|uniref:MmgE/PrpD family protein n=1 Tax=Variovorax boronicumulans TaxID=436515 RepID=UPI0009EEE901|nr:MmgE/PrpD family protein [Variovorax boronicumulans]
MSAASCAGEAEQPQGLTRAFAAFVQSAACDHMPVSVHAEAQRAIADCLGGALAGAGEPVSIQAARLAETGTGPCTLWAQPRRASARDAALINGCAAHAHAIDDTNESMRGHPSAPIVPAVLALGEEIGVAGPALVEAYVVGVEIAAKLGLAVNDRHSQLGWHTTCTLGAVGAAASCAKLLGLDEMRTVHALGIAASMAAGLRVNFGSMTKPLHAGLAAHNGVLAARLAEAGVTASAQALEGHEGFLALFCGDDARPQRALAALGQPFELVAPGIVYKQYPTCSLMHALVDMAIETRAHRLPELVGASRIRCGISTRLGAARRTVWPTSGMEAKFHVEYCVAVALLGGTQGLTDFVDAALERPDVRALAQRIEVAPGIDFPAGNGDFAELHIEVDGQTVFHDRRAKPRGHPSQPLSDAEHRDKFMACASLAMDGAAAAELLSALRGTPFPDARTLGRLLAATR